MKLILPLFAVCITLILFSFAKPMQDESTYVNKYIKYSVERDGSSAKLTLDLVNIEQYDELYLRRSDNPTDNFRQVRYLKKNEIADLSREKIIVDKYPLPGNTDAYYKLVAIDSKGIYKLFPCVKLSKY